MIEITIKGSEVRYTPLWETVQRVIRETTGIEDGRLTCIARNDGGHAYRDPGSYSLTFTPWTRGDAIEIKLEVSRHE